MTPFLASLVVLGLSCSHVITLTSALAAHSDRGAGFERRHMLHTTIATLTTAASTRAGVVHAADANGKSRTNGYAVQRTEREWAYVLSWAQYNILRRGGTERQKSSILNQFSAADRGTYSCAGCSTALFSSTAKFASKTGWPSFASSLPGVEIEDLNPVRATLNGREVRCRTCGGHLGDLFNDGWVYVGTSAAKTGQRYCIDGAALVFRPQDGGPDVFGDQPPPSKTIKYEASIYRDSR